MLTRSITMVGGDATGAAGAVGGAVDGAAGAFVCAASTDGSAATANAISPAPNLMLDLPAHAATS
jgi:hypothetical protein